jgi:hypothetical protein
MPYFTPGVIIEEVTGVGVIAGVATSTAGFIGAALNGPVAEPRRIFNWEEFEAVFGRPGSGPRPDVYVTAPVSYLAHAVAGFFANGGGEAYICRAGVAARASYEPQPISGAGRALRIEALEEGVAGNQITVTIGHSSLASGVDLARPTATIQTAQGRRILVNDARPFRVGDIVRREQASAEWLVIGEINVDTREIFVTSDMTGNATGQLRLAPLEPGTRRFRVTEAKHLFAGSVITIAQTGVTAEPPATVASVVADTVTLEKGITGTFSMTSNAQVKVTSHEFDLTIGPAPNEPFTGLSTSRRHPRYYEKVVRSQRVRVRPSSGPPDAPPPNDRPAIPATQPQSLQAGKDDDLFAIGVDAYKAAIDAFDGIDDVNFLAVPDAQDTVTQNRLIDHCVRHGDRVAILDTPRGADIDAALTHRGAVESERGFGALYHPWLLVPDPSSAGGETMPVPPSGHAAGIFARVDANPGVHKAPANEIVRGAVGLAALIGDQAQAPLNREGVNTIRVFPGRARPVVWGARTTVATDVTDWRYVNVRRLLCYIEESIQEGLRGAVFRPNDLALWQQLKRSLTAFLTGVWRDGALFGATADEAFRVRIDEAINPPASRNLGELHIEVKVAPVRPAEFIVVRIALFDGEAEAIEA